MEFLTWCEQLSLSTWVRESGSLWSYPFILFLHTIGLGFLAGLSVAMDARLLGVASKMPVSPLAKFFPLMWFGFWVNAISGTILLMADATTKAINPVFYTKMGFVTLGVLIMWRLQHRFFKDPKLDEKPVSARGKTLAILSLLCWAGAITAGRLMAYIGPVSGLPGQTNHL